MKVDMMMMMMMVFFLSFLNRNYRAGASWKLFPVSTSNTQLQPPGGEKEKKGHFSPHQPNNRHRHTVGKQPPKQYRAILSFREFNTCATAAAVTRPHKRDVEWKETGNKDFFALSAHVIIKRNLLFILLPLFSSSVDPSSSKLISHYWTRKERLKINPLAWSHSIRSKSLIGQHRFCTNCFCFPREKRENISPAEQYQSHVTGSTKEGEKEKKWNEGQKNNNVRT